MRKLALNQIAPIAAKVDEWGRVSPELMRILDQVGFLRYRVPEEYRGCGVKVVQMGIIRGDLAQVLAQADSNFIIQGLVYRFEDG